jgi:hypothetical protein
MPSHIKVVLSVRLPLPNPDPSSRRIAKTAAWYFTEPLPVAIRQLGPYNGENHDVRIGAHGLAFQGGYIVGIPRRDDTRGVQGRRYASPRGPECVPRPNDASHHDTSHLPRSLRGVALVTDNEQQAAQPSHNGH